VPTYAVGDLQGCLAPLEELLANVAFDAARDRLWLVGDLVNRGPDSLGCLRFAKSLGEAAVVVLGNHDLHLLSVAEGFSRGRSRDTLEQVLQAPDRGELLDWLRRRPLMHVEGGFAMVHGGLLPSWSVGQARALAGEVEEALRGPGYRALLRDMYGDEPDSWNAALAGIARSRVIINAMTRLRVCTPDGRMVLGFKGDPADLDGKLLPWFDVSGRASRGTTVVCGHWSALGLKMRGDLLALDSGCVWGRALSAVRLEDRKLFQVPCRGAAGRED
jgi:bis(5'-nucleosyl)-tetraphosphatase (symmetrical)